MNKCDIHEYERFYAATYTLVVTREVLIVIPRDELSILPRTNCQIAHFAAVCCIPILTSLPSACAQLSAQIVFISFRQIWALCLFRIRFPKWNENKKNNIRSLCARYRSTNSHQLVAGKWTCLHFRLNMHSTHRTHLCFYLIVSFRWNHTPSCFINIPWLFAKTNRLHRFYSYNNSK